MSEEVNGWPTAHRPWPVPDAPWVMYQEWHDMLFAHWPVDAEELRPLIPVALLLDLHSESAWITITPFQLKSARSRLTPAIPGLSDFPELNVRTYVTFENKPGVWFFSLDAGSALAVAGARTLFHLPYLEADMEVREAGAWIGYSSSRTDPNGPPAAFRGQYRPSGEVFQAERETLEYFLTERYCLYATDNKGTLYRCQIHHLPWPLQTAEAEIKTNTMAAAAGITLPARPPLLHFARFQPTVVWLPERL
jgi:uncharacterized protein YqjF (DUF2071 family)